MPKRKAPDGHLLLQVGGSDALSQREAWEDRVILGDPGGLTLGSLCPTRACEDLSPTLQTICLLSLRQSPSGLQAALTSDSGLLEVPGHVALGFLFL